MFTGKDFEISDHESHSHMNMELFKRVNKTEINQFSIQQINRL